MMTSRSSMIEETADKRKKKPKRSCHSTWWRWTTCGLLLLIVVTAGGYAFFLLHDKINSSDKTSNALLLTQERLPCEDWAIFKDEKCFIVVSESHEITHEEAEIKCKNLSKLSAPSKLPTVNSQDEQDFLQRFLFIRRGIVDDIWLGLKDIGEINAPEWNDGSFVNYTNWANQTEVHANYTCAVLRPGKQGLWFKEDCQKSNAVVCERIQPWSLPKMQFFMNAMLARDDVRQAEQTIHSEMNEATNTKIASLEKKIIALEKDNEKGKNNIQALEEANEAANNDFKALETKFHEAQRNISSLEVRYEEAVNKISFFEKNIEDSKQKLIALEEGNEDTKHEIRILEQANKEAKNDIETLETKFEEARQTLTFLGAQYEEAINKINLLEKTTEASQKNITALQIDNKSSTKKIEILEMKGEEDQNNIAVLSSEREDVNVKIEALETKSREMQENLTALVLQNEEETNKINVFEKKIEDSGRNTAALQQENAKAKKKVESLDIKNREVQRNFTALEIKFKAVEDKIIVLETAKDPTHRKITALEARNVLSENKFNMLTQKNSAMENQLSNLQQNPVPIGFVYVQLPGQWAPSAIWRNVNWRDISSAYAGLFFRVAGGGAAPFNETQYENSPRLNQVQFIAYNHDSYGPLNIPSDGSWSQRVVSGANAMGSWCSLRFRMTTGEVRPINKAVKVWQRTA